MNSNDWTIDWSYENLTKLIKLYASEPALWDPLHRDRHVKTKKTGAWAFIAQEMGCEVMEVKNKMTSLLSSYRREKMKTKKSMENAEGGEKIYKSKWFGYKFFSFLKDREMSYKIKRNAKKKQKKLLLRKNDSFKPSENDINLRYNECMTFGNYLSTKLQKLNEQQRNFLMHRINNLIFEAEMELCSQKYDGYLNSASSPSSISDVASEYNHCRFQSTEPESVSPYLQLNHDVKESSPSNSQ